MKLSLTITPKSSFVGVLDGTWNAEVRRVENRTILPPNIKDGCNHNILWFPTLGNLWNAATYSLHDFVPHYRNDMNNSTN